MVTIRKKSKYIGDKDFYKKVLLIAVPIMLQNGITNFVGMLDNIMVGQIGTEQMSGVSIVNQLIFILILCVFGATSGAGVLGAQYYGNGDMKGVRDVFRIKILFAIVLLLLATGIFWLFGEDLISLYLHDGSASGDLEATLYYAKIYLQTMMIGNIPLVFEISYSSTLRESGETSVPMRASIVSVFVNLILNYVLIYGKFGMPKMGVIGAAVATIISRFVSLGIVMGWAHTHKERAPYFTGAYRSFKVPMTMVRKILVLALPLLMNETLWSASVAAQTVCYSVRGLSVVAALNINSTIYNVFNIIFIALGDSVAIIVGQQLGAGKVEEGKLTAYRIILFSVFSCFFIGALMFFVAPLFPRIYNTSDEVKTIAGNLIRIQACVMPLQAFLHATYFTIRSGGKTVITFLFDSGFMWAVAVPLAFILAHYTPLPITMIFLCCQLSDLIKAVIGFGIMKSGTWARTIVG